MKPLEIRTARRLAAGYGVAIPPQGLVNCRGPNVAFEKIAWKDAPQLAIAFVRRTNVSGPAAKALIEVSRADASRKSDPENDQ